LWIAVEHQNHNKIRTGIEQIICKIIHEMIEIQRKYHNDVIHTTMFRLSFE